MIEMCKVAYQYAKANNLNIVSDKSKNFLQRRKDLRVHKREALSAARTMSMNKRTIGNELLLGSLGTKEVFSHIWNCDESGLP